MAEPGQYKEQFLQALSDFGAQIYAYLFRITNDEDLAATALFDTFKQAYRAYGRVASRSPRTQRNWLLKIATALASEREPKGQRLTFEMLDELIRSDPTRITQVRGLSDPEREDLTWDLQQDCLTSVLTCLSKGERQAFTLVTLTGLDQAHAAAILDVSESAFRVRLSRASQKVSDYLAPRCSLIDPSNPCRCQSRLGVAMAKEFVRPHSRKRSKAPSSETRAEGDVLRLYEALPAPEPDDKLLAEIRSSVLEGAWDQVSDAKTKT